MVQLKFRNGDNSESIIEVSPETAKVWDDFMKRRKTCSEAVDELYNLDYENRRVKLISVYLIADSNFASIIFVLADLYNRPSGPNLDKSKMVSEWKRGLVMHMNENSIHVINPMPILRVSVIPEGKNCHISVDNDKLRAGFYSMFKCYEMIGFTDMEVEWACLLAAEERRFTEADVGTPLSFAKSIVQQLHVVLMDDEMTVGELEQLNRFGIITAPPSLQQIKKVIGSIGSYIVMAVLFTVLAILYLEMRRRFV